MKLISNKDTYAYALSTASLDTIPFISLGIVCRTAMFYVALTLGVALF